MKSIGDIIWGDDALPDETLESIDTQSMNYACIEMCCASKPGGCPIPWPPSYLGCK